MQSRRVASNIIAASIFVVVVVVVLYGFSHHYLLINTCSGNRTLVGLNTGPVCFPDIYNTIIANGTPYTINSSLAASGGRIIPLSFKFIGNDPLLYIWNQNTSQALDSYIFLTIPDTFKVHMQYTSSVPTEFIVMTNSQYVQWVNSGETSSSNVFEASGESVSTWFNDSAGCAGYIAVIKAATGAAFTISPNETALYAPATSPTGVCA